MGGLEAKQSKQGIKFVGLPVKKCATLPGYLGDFYARTL